MNNKTFVCFFFFFLETGLKIVHTVLKLATQCGDPPACTSQGWDDTKRDLECWGWDPDLHAIGKHCPLSHIRSPACCLLLKQDLTELTM